MDTRVKERLVGAVILVGIIVALVPEMLSGPRQASPGRNEQGALRTYTIDLAPPAETAAPLRDVTPSDLEPSKPAAEDDTAAPVGAPEAETQAPARSGSTSQPAPAESSPSTSSQPRAPPQVPARVSTQPAAVPGSGWVVQLGSFASRENAERLAETLKRGGYRAFVSRFESGKLVRHRVRVGPEEDRAKAEALAQRLRREGRQVSIVSHP